MKNLKIIVFLTTIIVMLCAFNTCCYAEYSFLEVNYNIDNVGISELELTYYLKQIFGFKVTFVPYIIILSYIIIQIVLIKKYKNEQIFNNFKLCLKLNIIVVLLICAVNKCISLFFIDKTQEIKYITSTIFIYKSHLWLEITNIVINMLILVFGLIFSKKLLKNSIEQKELHHSKKMLIITILLIIVLIVMHFVVKRGPLMHVVEKDNDFGYPTYIKYYDLKCCKGKEIGDTDLHVLVKDIDDEGVLIEYKRGEYVEKQDNSNDSSISSSRLISNYDYKTEIVEQKMKWNVNYSYKRVYSPWAGKYAFDYYVRFEK